MNTKKRKLLHIHFGKEGGAERFFVNLVKAFNAEGQEQRFIIRPDRTWEHEITPLGDVIFNNYRRASISSLFLEYRVRKLIDQWQPDAIMAWMPRAARLIPNYGDAIKLTRLGDFPAHLRHFKNCDVLVGNIPGIGRHCKEIGWEKAVRTVSNFPRNVKAEPIDRKSLDTPEDAFVISSSGRFVNRKGFDLLIKAAAKIPNAYLWLIGDGKERTNLEALAREEGIEERVKFIGWVDEPGHYVSASDTFVMASRHEPFGNVAIEAWQLNIPVVSTRSEGPSWYMDHKNNAYLIDIDDLDELVNGLNLIRTDKKFAAQIIKGANDQLEAMFTTERIVSQYFELFDTKVSDL